jgi:hydrogenase nickel incorporation protein HypB
LRQGLLQKNARAAARNRAWFEARRVTALNLIGAPGAGKTALLERCVVALGRRVPVAILEGDQATDHDAQRLLRLGAKVLQINTDTGCHLDADMVWNALPVLQPADGSLLLIENVGNLVCPSLFDLGERAKVVVMSVTEGEDKPLKYPHVFRAAEALAITKLDLLDAAGLDLARCIANAK